MRRRSVLAVALVVSVLPCTVRAEGDKSLPPVPPVAAATDAARPTASFPRTIPEARAEAEAATQPRETWPAQEVELARARCTQLLKTVDAVTLPEPPVREGDCGAPAPVRLVSVGRNPEVAISPPALVTCDFVVALHSWLKGDVQPLARKYLGSAIVKIESMSDYSCRNAYGRVKTRLSEHGRANALDIRGFLAQSGQMVTVLDDWGMTAREVAAAVAAEKKAAEKAAAAAALAEAEARRKAAVAGKALPPNAGSTSVADRSLSVPPDVLNRRTLVEGLPRVSIGTGGGDHGAASSAPTATFDLMPSKLGGPKPAIEKNPAVDQKPASQNKSAAEPHAKKPLKRATQAAAPAIPAGPPSAEAKALFLRNAHAAGCRIFGTVLGPEANNAHRNHLHVDVAERTTGAFCE